MRHGIGAPAAVFVAIVIIVGGSLAILASTSNAPQVPGNNTKTTTITTANSTAETVLRGTGPISTYPALWTDVCGFPVHGNATTDNQLASSFQPGIANFSLSQLYLKIVTSAGFQNLSKGQGWVTISWGSYEAGGPDGYYQYVEGQFLLVSGGQPGGVIQASYNISTGEISYFYEPGLTSSCPAIGVSSEGASLAKGSPSYYQVGEPIEIDYSVSDYREANMNVTSTNSCLGGFVILEGFGTTGPLVYNSSMHSGCEGEPLNLTLQPGQSYNQTRFWNQTTDSGAQVQPGEYEVMGVIGGSAQPAGVVYIGEQVVPVSSTILQQQFYYQGNLDNSVVSVGQHVRVAWVLTNNGQMVYDLETSGCSYYYKVLNLNGSMVFDSAKLPCNQQLEDNSAPPSGGISQVAYWNQTTNSGGQVGPGFYRFEIDLRVWSGGQEFTLASDWDLEISSPTAATPTEVISVASSSICVSSCGVSSPYLYSSVYAKGNLKSLTLYLNGTLVDTMTYNLTCPDLTCQVTFNTPIDNGTFHITPGTYYDVVFIGTFNDGQTSISWANPVNTATQG